jgi:hypothetical protein
LGEDRGCEREAAVPQCAYVAGGGAACHTQAPTAANAVSGMIFLVEVYLAHIHNAPLASSIITQKEYLLSHTHVPNLAAPPAAHHPNQL